MRPVAATRFTCAEAGYTTLRLATTAGTAGQVDAYGRNAGPSLGSNHGMAIAESDTGICPNRCEPVAQISKHPPRVRESNWDYLSRTACHEESPSPMSLDTAVPPPVAREVADGLPPGPSSGIGPFHGVQITCAGPVQSRMYISTGARPYLK